MQSPPLLFDKSAIPFILDAFGFGEDTEGYVVEKASPTQRVLSPSGEEIQTKEFAGITRGSLLLFKSDLPSLIELADRLS